MTRLSVLAMTYFFFAVGEPMASGKKWLTYEVPVKQLVIIQILTEQCIISKNKCVVEICFGSVI